MRYLRMFTNAVAGGVIVATYLAVVVFQVNPQLPVVSTTGLSWFGAVAAFYAPYVSVALFLLMLALDLVFARPLLPAWVSVRLLGWLGAAAASTASVLMWSNLRAFAPVLSDAAIDRMRDGAWATSIAASVLLTILALRYSFGRRGSRLVGAVLVVSLLFSVAVPLWLRGPGEAPVRVPARPADIRRASARSVYGSPAPRVYVYALDGASLGFIRQRVAAGQLPNFGRLLDRGATIDLATLKPTEAEPIWVAAATGKSPQKNGVRSSTAFRVRPSDLDTADVLPDYCLADALVDQGFVRPTPLGSSSMRARPMWEILSDYGIASGVAGWPVTYPARAERGYVLSDQFDEAASSPLRTADASAGDPTTAVDVARVIFDDWQARPWSDVLPGVGSGEREPVGGSRARWDRAYHDTVAALEQQFAPRLTAVRYEGLDALGQIALRDAQPELFGDPRRADPRFSVLDRHYDFLDREIGGVVSRLAPGELLIVVSGYGTEAKPLGQRLVASALGRLGLAGTRVLGNPDATGTHESGPDGFLMAYGTNVASGQFPAGTVMDLAPTILYYMGIDVGRDMDGFARTDLFVTTYALEHPVKYVASHEG